MKELQIRIINQLLTSLNSNIRARCDDSGKKAIDAHKYFTALGIHGPDGAIEEVVKAVMFVMNEPNSEKIYEYFAGIKVNDIFFREIKEVSEDMISDHLLIWLRTHPFIAINRLEHQLKCPSGTLHKPVNGEKRKIPREYIAQLVELLKPYGY